MKFKEAVVVILSVFVCLSLGAAWTNMNGNYLIANPNEDTAPFSTDYSTKNVEYFEMYSLPIPTVYGQVYWTLQDPQPLPEDIIKRYANKTMAMTGYEVDQVWKTDQGDYSVPIYYSYNHHYSLWLMGNGSVVGEVMAHDLHGHKEIPTPKYRAYTDTTYIPEAQYISEGNGGEFRKSYHGYPAGYAQLLYSPQYIQFLPMQIDTHNRDYTGPGFKAGLVPRSCLAPENASYSCLLECPCTTRTKKTWQVTYVSQFKEKCETGVQNATECYNGVSSLGLNIVSKQSINDSSIPSGCHILYADTQNVGIVYNEYPKSEVNCTGSKVIAGYNESVVKIHVLLDSTEGEGTAYITMTGPDGVWFGVGFNANSMANRPYVIVIDGKGAVSEHKIGDHAPGSVISPTMATIVNFTVTNGQRTVTLKRPFKGVSPQHYTFSIDTPTIPFINAVGLGPNFSYHQTKASSSLSLFALGKPTCICNDGMHGWINGIVFNKNCLPEPRGDLVAQKNPSCWIQTFQGGQFCCHHGTILLDADQPVDQRTDTTYLKVRFYYQDYVPATPTAPASHLNLYRFYYQTESYSTEYDIIQCPKGTPVSSCVSEITARWQVKDMIGCDSNNPECWKGFTGFELIYAGGHCHAPSCISIELYNADNGELLCRQTPLFGTGSTAKYDELSYLHIPPCLWGYENGLVPPMRLQMDTNLLSIKKNNNTYGHYGEMASWQMRGVFLP